MDQDAAIAEFNYLEELRTLLPLSISVAQARLVRELRDQGISPHEIGVAVGRDRSNIFRREAQALAGEAAVADINWSEVAEHLGQVSR